MSLFDVHIITCSATANRLPPLIASLQDLFNDQNVRKISLICSYDIDFIDESFFKADLWDSMIENIYPILLKNFHEVRKAVAPHSAHAKSFWELMQNDLFPHRSLRNAEKSLVLKHYTSLKQVTIPTLTIEDDAHIIADKIPILHDLVDYIQQNDCYVDLGYMEGLERRGSKIKMSNNCSGFYTPIGLTRTTCAYLVGPSTATKVIKSFWPCALPSDLHLQYLLFKERIAGIWPDEKLFQNLSNEGIVLSSIQ